MLALAVVSEAGGLEDAGQAELAGGEVEIVQGMDGPERGDGEAVLAEEGFLAKALLGDVEDVAVGPDGGDLGGGAGGVGRNILEFEGDDIDVTSERADAVEILVVGDYLEICDLTGWGILIG